MEADIIAVYNGMSVDLRYITWLRSAGSAS